MTNLKEIERKLSKWGARTGDSRKSKRILTSIFSELKLIDQRLTVLEDGDRVDITGKVPCLTEDDIKNLTRKADPEHAITPGLTDEQLTGDVEFPAYDESAGDIEPTVEEEAEEIVSDGREFRDVVTEDPNFMEASVTEPVPEPLHTDDEKADTTPDDLEALKDQIDTLLNS